MTGRPRRMVGWPYHGGKDASLKAEAARRLLALLEKAHPDAPAPIRRQKHRLAKIEKLLDLQPALGEGPRKRVEMLRQWCRRRRADQFLAIEGADDDRLVGGEIGRKVTSLVVGVAVVEIGIVAKDGDAQPRQIVKAGLRLVLAKPADSRLMPW